jgi:hypothetical protein
MKVVITTRQQALLIHCASFYCTPRLLPWLAPTATSSTCSNDSSGGNCNSSSVPHKKLIWTQDIFICNHLRLFSYKYDSRGSSVSIVTRLEAARLGFDSRQGNVRDFSLRHRVQIASEGHAGSYPMGIGSYFHGGKAAGA